MYCYVQYSQNSCLLYFRIVVFFVFQFLLYLQEVNETNERNRELLEENAKLIGHQNHKQKIHYTGKLKDENNFLREVSKSYICLCTLIRLMI